MNREITISQVEQGIKLLKFNKPLSQDNILNKCIKS